MQKIFLLLFSFILLLMSCRRESSIERALRPMTGDSGILFKRIDVSTRPGVAESATSTSTYKYSATGKLITQLYSSTSGNRTGSSESQYIRDNKDRIVAIEAKFQELLNGVPYITPEGPASHTSVTKVIYRDGSSPKINYQKTIMRSGEKTAIDSTVYEYDDHGHVKKTTSYYLPGAVHQPGDKLISTGYTAWTFNTEGSLTEIGQYKESNGNVNLEIRYRFEYDDKINPMFTGEYVCLDNWFDISPHNVVKQHVYIPVFNENYVNTAVYQYRADNKPLSVSYFSPPTVVIDKRDATFLYK